MKTDTEMLDWVAENVVEIATLKQLGDVIEINYSTPGGNRAVMLAGGETLKEAFRAAVRKAMERGGA